MNTLFDTAPLIAPTAPTPGLRCKHCRHLYEHQYNNTKYCSKQRQKRTSYGHKKIKANDAACMMFENLVTDK